MFNPCIVKAICCNSLLMSKNPGNFSRCKCGDSFIDQTNYYTRSSGQLKTIGNIENLSFPTALYYHEEFSFIVLATLIEDKVLIEEYIPELPKSRFLTLDIKEAAINRLSKFSLIGYL